MEDNCTAEKGSGLNKESSPLRHSVPAYVQQDLRVSPVLTFEAELTHHRFCLCKDQIHNGYFSAGFSQGMSKGSSNSLPSACDVGHLAIQTQTVKDAAPVITPEDVIPHHFFLKQKQIYIAQ